MTVNKNTFVIGFMLFAIFFGAGNLIFPSALGLESGQTFWPALLGFVSTGVGLPLLGIIVSAYYQDGYRTALNRIHPWFSLLFLAVVYLTIGPFFAIPRTGATSYEMAVVPFLGEPGSTSLLIFSLVYYGITLWLSLNPSKMVERIGAILTPVLLVCILALIGKAAFWLWGRPPTLTNVQSTGAAAYLNGFVNGYLTMDVLASVAFSVIVITAIRARMLTKGTQGDGSVAALNEAVLTPAQRRQLIVQTSLAGIVAATALAIIYVGLGWFSNRLPVDPAVLADLKERGQDLGTYLLTTAAYSTFGEFGRVLFGLIVTLACLTTSVGLVTAVSEFFNDIFPRISYVAYAVICTLIGFLLANQGLSAVIDKSVPVLMVLYPVVMTILLIMLIETFVTPLPLLAQRLAVGMVMVVSILSVAGTDFSQHLPLKAYSLEWLPFAVVAIVLGVVVAWMRRGAAREEGRS